MNINRKELEKIVEKVLEELSGEKKPDDFYIVFSSPWNNLYYLAIEELKNTDANLNALISEDIEKSHIEMIKENINWKKTTIFGKDTDLQCGNGKTIFLSLGRNDVIDIANLYCGRFESRFVRDRLSKGQEVFYWKKGLEKLTGKEPEAYQKKLLKYYKEILEFGISPVELKVVKE